MIKCLFEYGKWTEDYSCGSLIDAAVTTGDAAVLSLVLEAGAQLDYPWWPNTPLQNTVKAGKIEMTRLLCAAGVDVNAIHGHGLPALHIAADLGDVETVEILINAGADIFLAPSANITAFEIAERQAKDEVLGVFRAAQAVSATKMELDASSTPKTDLCNTCKDISPRDDFFTHSWEWHESLIALQKSARSGCPFCRFIWKQLGITDIPIPQPSRVMFYRFKRDYISCQIDEPYPADIECPRHLGTTFHYTTEPFDGTRKPLVGDTSSPQTFAQIRSWLDNCTKNHSKCKKASLENFTPTRLLDISPIEESGAVRLVETSSTPTHARPFIALSHCQHASLPESATTTTSILQSRYNGIAIESLPLTFTHMFHAAKNLGIRYCWIDTLCTIQDDPTDLAHEASCTSSIYRSAFCTLAAAALDCYTRGLFRSSDTRNDAVEFETKFLGGEKKRTRFFRRQESWQKMLAAGPLCRRGWGMQERELSPRPSPPQQPNVYDLWHRLVNSYTARILPRPEDTFPALSNLAHLVSNYTNSSYIAGLWQSDLLRSLAWASYGNYNESHLSRHPSYIAPTWSWASVRGPKTSTNIKATHQDVALYSKSRSSSSDEAKGAVEIIAVNVELAGSDPFGQISSAELKITASICRAVLGYDKSSNQYGRTIQLRNRAGDEVMGDLYLDVPEEQAGLKMVFCVYLFPQKCTGSWVHERMGENGCGVGLAVVPVEDGGEGRFRRVGWVSCLQLAAVLENTVRDFTLI
ncbi:hypothetical protein EJ04DRAFT_501363 [Polyplosphaeria fusca]|uniref:Heterokaryon incompatibility domain-containing protein n=1 Tax=Polyplosphaeria fusca TaxID=682080 RepID=A0A9P4QSE9_9PLEO|nr:hypothetical protein EJ04DRAFT_501363 [Polyplosphaeria fusca]